MWKKRSFGGSSPRSADHVHGTHLDLVAVQHGIALAIPGVVVAQDAHIVAAANGVVVQPVDRRRDADGLILVLLEVEEDVVANDVAVVVHGYELLGHVDRKIRDAVNGKLADQLERIGAHDVEVGHGAIGRTEPRCGARPSARRAIREFLHDARHDGGEVFGPSSLTGLPAFGSPPRILPARLPSFPDKAMPRLGGYFRTTRLRAMRPTAASPLHGISGGNLNCWCG
jgi:hypothetical protein